MSHQGFIRAFLAFFLLVAASAGASENETEARTAFEKAARLYSNEHFADAHLAYSQLAEEWVSPEILCNAGSAAYRAGNDGQATLWFKRALVLNSTFAEAKQNLRFLRRKQGFLRFEAGPLREFAGMFRTPTWLLILIFSGGLSAIAGLSIAFLRLRAGFRPALIWAVALGALAAGISTTGYVAKARDREVRSTFIVTGTQARALTAPNDSAGLVVALPPGSEVSYLEQRGQWIYADIPSGSRGWVRTTSLEKLWPYSSKLVE